MSINRKQTTVWKAGDTDLLVRRDLLSLKAYEPIKPPDVSDTVDGEKLQRKKAPARREIIKLNGNENPYGCSPRVQKALATTNLLHIYPDPDQDLVRAELSKYVGVDAKNIVVGSGSDELIDLTFRLFLEPGDRVINCTPTFGMYSVNTEICGGKAVNVPRYKDFAIDVHTIEDKMDSRTKIIVVASPNNPDGSITPPMDILRLLRTGAIVLVDEAYFEFTNGVTLAKEVIENSNLIVVRTFSKWAGLAGLRVGYGIFPQKIADRIMAIKPPYNVNIAAQIAVLESMKDLPYLRKNVALIRKEKDRMYKALQSVSFLQPYPSEANFILSRVTKGGAKNLRDFLLSEGIMTRYFDTPGLQDCLRISVGKPEHTDAVMAAMRKFKYNSK